MLATAAITISAPSASDPASNMSIHVCTSHHRKQVKINKNDLTAKLAPKVGPGAKDTLRVQSSPDSPSRMWYTKQISEIHDI